MTDLFAGPDRRVGHNRYGWYRLSELPPLPDGTQLKDMPRVTTLKGTLDDTWNLQAWESERIAEGLTLRPELYDRMRRVMGTADLKDVLAEAKRAGGGHEGSDMGTLLHSVLELADTGALTEESLRTLLAQTWEIDGPRTRPVVLELLTWLRDNVEEFVAGYRKALANRNLRMLPEYCEKVVVNTELGYAGRIDRIFEDMGPGRLPETRLEIGDVKSQKWTPGDYDRVSMSIQLAVYANASWIFDESTWTWSPMPEVRKDIATCAWTPAKDPGHCELFAVPIGDGYHHAKAAHQVRQLRKLKGFRPR